MNFTPLVFFGNGQIAIRVLRYLVETGDTPDLVILHPEENSHDYQNLLRFANDARIDVVMADTGLKNIGNIISEINPVMGISAYFGYIFHQGVIDLFQRGIINLHGSLLPWNRGTNPNVWTIVDDTRAGVSIHYVDNDIDTGPLLVQREFPISHTTTGQELYSLTIDHMVSLFEESWPSIRDGLIRPKQQKGKGSFHKRDELDMIKRLDLEKELKVGQLIRILRACTFPPYPSAYFIDNNKKYQITVSIEEMQE